MGNRVCEGETTLVGGHGTDRLDGFKTLTKRLIEATAKLGSGAVNATIDALAAMDSKNENIRVREGLIRILGELKDPRAVETLESLSQHKSERIRDAVDRALFKIRGF